MLYPRTIAAAEDNYDRMPYRRRRTEVEEQTSPRWFPLAMLVAGVIIGALLA